MIKRWNASCFSQILNEKMTSGLKKQYMNFNDPQTCCKNENYGLAKSAQEELNLIEKNKKWVTGEEWQNISQ